jgi:CheY-like chemotaxis protein
MTQVISNLLNNAAKFTEPKGRIGLTVVRQSNEVVISVTDTGAGVAVADLPRIFDLFAQIDQSRDHSSGGLGIGLALSKRLAEMHGGTVHATSAGVGLGSEFVVRLPLQREAPTTLAPGKPEGHVPSGASRRILVVDDNRDGADSLSMLLRADGHDTQAAYDGKSALEVAEAFRPEVVVLDIGLPMMDGYDVCRHLRAQTWATGLLVIALTGWGSAQDRRRAQDAGIDHHLVKPVQPAVLRQLLAMPSPDDARPPGIFRDRDRDRDPGRAPAPRS